MINNYIWNIYKENLKYDLLEQEKIYRGENENEYLNKLKFIK